MKRKKHKNTSFRVSLINGVIMLSNRSIKSSKFVKINACMEFGRIVFQQEEPIDGIIEQDMRCFWRALPTWFYALSSRNAF